MLTQEITAPQAPQQFKNMKSIIQFLKAFDWPRNKFAKAVQIHTTQRKTIHARALRIHRFTTS